MQEKERMMKKKDEDITTSMQEIKKTLEGKKIDAASVFSAISKAFGIAKHLQATGQTMTPDGSAEFIASLVAIFGEEFGLTKDMQASIFSMIHIMSSLAQEECQTTDERDLKAKEGDKDDKKTIH